MTSLVEGKRGRGRPRIFLIDNILTWTGITGTDLMNAVRDRRSWALGSTSPFIRAGKNLGFKQKVFSSFLGF